MYWNDVHFSFSSNSHQVEKYQIIHNYNYNDLKKNDDKQEDKKKERKHRDISL